LGVPRAVADDFSHEPRARDPAPRGRVANRFKGTRMKAFSFSVIWFNRLVLAAATVIMSMIAVRHLRDPVGATLPLDIVLGSPRAVTVVRAGFGGFPLGVAIVLFACLMSTRRLLAGVLLLAAIIGAVTTARVQGLLVDGPTAYNVRLLRPEI